MPPDELIVFTRSAGMGPTSIWTVRPDGTGATMLYAPRDGIGLSDATLSNDGRRLVAIGRRSLPRMAGDMLGQIYVLDIEGLALQQVTIDESIKLRPAWSHDGREIVFERSGPKGYHLFSINVDGTVPRQLTGPPIDLAKFAEPSTTAASSLKGFVHSAEEHRKIVGEPEPTEEMPAWSPDGSTIAFVRITPGEDDGPGSHSIWIMGADGSHPQGLTSGDERDLSPAWSPDGKEIVFTRVRKPDWSIDRIEPPEMRLMGVDPESGAIRELFSTPAGLEDPCVSPDGREIVFRHGDDATRGIAAVGTDGTGLRFITHPSGEEHDYHPTWQRIADLPN